MEPTLPGTRNESAQPPPRGRGGPGGAGGGGGAGGAEVGRRDSGSSRGRFSVENTAFVRQLRVVDGVQQLSLAQPHEVAIETTVEGTRVNFQVRRQGGKLGSRLGSICKVFSLSSPSTRKWPKVLLESGRSLGSAG
jgi:hypothetical protein